MNKKKIRCSVLLIIYRNYCKYSFKAVLNEYQIFSIFMALSFPCLARRLRYSCEYRYRVNYPKIPILRLALLCMGTNKYNYHYFCLLLCPYTFSGKSLRGILLPKIQYPTDILIRRENIFTNKF
jgi:hypothetical protein